MAATGSSAGMVRFTSDTTLTWYSPDPNVAYAFCSTCGSSLFWRAAAQPDHLSICAGTLDQPTGLQTSTAWWTAEHGDYHTPEPNVTEFEHDSTRADLIRELYDAHEARDIDRALACLTEDVSWPNVAADTTMRGHDEARRYWTDQFRTIDPHVTPTHVDIVDDTARVQVHQVVRDSSGNVLHEGTVVHVFSFDGDRVSAMEIEIA
jgi:ketosteroid isomerase-like protein